MASTDARPWPIKAQAFRWTFPLYKSDGTLITGAAGLDSEVSKDAGTFADCTNEATEIATASGWYYIDLTSTEMTADTVAYQCKSSSTGAVVATATFLPVAIVEPSGAPAFGTGIEEVLAWILAMARNKKTQTATTTTLRNDADSADVSTSTVSDDGTTYTQGEWT